MRKSTRIVKKYIAAFLIVLMSIENFAAVVGDNDGAAFITKAEFDSLKNNFQSQIDQYNTSIDSKIDGAIASYLAGITVSSVDQVTLPLSTYKKVYCFNKPINTTYCWPSFGLFTTIAFHNIYGGVPFNGYWSDYMRTTTGYTGADPNQWREWYFSGNAYININYINNSVCKKAKITGVNESTGTGNAIWDGVATDWKTNIKLTGFAGQKGNLYAFEVRDSSHVAPSFVFSECTTFSSQRNVSNARDIYRGRFVYYHNHNTTGGAISYNNMGAFDKYDNVAFSITNDVDNDNFKHIISWTQNNDDWICYNRDWSKSIQTVASSSLTTKEFYEVVKGSITGWFDYDKMYYRYKSDETTTDGFIAGVRPEMSVLANERIVANNLTIQQATQSTILPEVGFVNTYTADNIFQDDTVVTQYIDGRGYSINPPKLNEGFVLGYAKAGDEIEWEPVFTEINYDDHFTPLTDGTQVCVMISTSPFTDAITTSDGSPLITTTNENGNQSDRNKTTNYKTKLKWTMPKDGWMYVKWMPDLSVAIDDVKNHTWNIGLDLTQCSTYSRTAE